MNRRGVKVDYLSSNVRFYCGLGVVPLYLVVGAGPFQKVGRSQGGCKALSSLTTQEE